VIGLYWIGHHRAFAHIRRFDHRLIVFNLVFLGLIAFQPWPTAVLGRYGGHRSAWRSGLADVGARRARYLAARAAMPATVFGCSIPMPYVSPFAAQLSWLSFVVLRRVVERRYRSDDTREGAFA
jgi:Endosomal/lysosomal potassium channel TMEM175